MRFSHSFAHRSVTPHSMFVCACLILLYERSYWLFEMTSTPVRCETMRNDVYGWSAEFPYRPTRSEQGTGRRYFTFVYGCVRTGYLEVDECICNKAHAVQGNHTQSLCPLCDRYAYKLEIIQSCLIFPVSHIPTSDSDHFLLCFSSGRHHRRHCRFRPAAAVL